MTTVYLLYREISDQYGTSEVAGVFSSRDAAEREEQKITQSRTYIREVPLDPVLSGDRPYDWLELLRQHDWRA